jgi:hypothetical protein
MRKFDWMTLAIATPTVSFAAAGAADRGTGTVFLVSPGTRVCSAMRSPSAAVRTLVRNSAA